MSDEGRQQAGKEERQGTPDFADMCKGAMPAAMLKRCGGQMREMMARCMAGSSDGEKPPADTGETEG